MKTQDKQAEITAFNLERHTDFALGSLKSIDIFMNEISNHFKPNVSIKKLELGCGTAFYGTQILNKYPKANIVGVDIAKGMVDFINKKQIQRYSAIVGDAENRKLFSEEEFDLIVCPFMLHHFLTPICVIENIEKWLKPNGVFIFIEPNGSSFPIKLFSIARKFLELICGKKYTARFATCNETNHSFRTYNKLLKKNNLQVINVTVFGKFNVKWNNFIETMRSLLHSVFDFLPAPYCGRGICVSSKRSNHSRF